MVQSVSNGAMESEIDGVPTCATAGVHRFDFCGCGGLTMVSVRHPQTDI